MPIPKPEDSEKSKNFVARCMGDETMKKEYPNNSQRVAICLGQTKKSSSSILEEVADAIEYIQFLEELDLGSTEEVTAENLYIPEEDEYHDTDEEIEYFNMLFSQYQYKDPMTNELYYYDRKGVYNKNGRQLVYMGRGSEYQGRKVTLNKPFRTPGGPKKSAVYVKNDKGKVVIVRFGDPNMKIKKNIPGRRKNFRARHNCDNPGPKWKARYWSCRAW
jgi:hypothetical protein